MRFEVELPDELESELQAAARESRISPITWAGEAVWSALASRRLPKVKPSVQCGRHNGTGMTRGDTENAAYELEPYRISLPDGGLEL